MYCKYCGQQIDDNAQFCPYCGKQLRDANDGSVKQGKNKREKAKKQVAVYDGRGNHKPPTKKDKGVGKTAAIILTAVVLIIFIVALSCRPGKTSMSSSLPNISCEESFPLRSTLTG